MSAFHVEQTESLLMHMSWLLREVCCVREQQIQMLVRCPEGLRYTELHMYYGSKGTEHKNRKTCSVY